MSKDNAVVGRSKIRIAFPREDSMVDRRTLLRGAAGVGAAALAAKSLKGAAAQDATPVVASGVDGVPDAYLEMPAPFQSYDGVPGRGGTVSAFVISYNPPPPGRDDNQYWQELERRLGVTWEPIITPQPNYGEKSAALIAAGDLPDLFYLNPGQNAPQQYQAMEEGAFLDLEPYLTGSAADEFPNLAAFPQFMYDNVRFNGKLYGVPKPLWRNGNIPFYRSDWATTLGLAAPTTPDEVKAMLAAFTTGDPDGNGSANTWGMGRFEGGWKNWDNQIAYNMFSTPYNWRLNDDGTLTHMIETEEFRAGTDFLRQVYAEGSFHPDSAAMTFSDAQTNFISGASGVHFEGFLSFYGIGSVTFRAQELNPAATTAGLVPPGGVTYNETGFFGYTAIPASIGDDEERVRELLRILDYLASPFGSEENTFINNGIEGVHHDIADTGAIIINDRGRAEKSDIPAAMGAQAVYYFPADPELAITVQELAKQAAAVGIDDPTLGLYSEANVENGGTLNQFGQDRMTEIVTGRDDLAALDDAVAEWRDRGGDDIRNQFQEAIQARG